MQQGAGGGGGKKRKRRNILDSEAMERLKEEFVLGSFLIMEISCKNKKDIIQTYQISLHYTKYFLFISDILDKPKIPSLEKTSIEYIVSNKINYKGKFRTSSS